MKQLLAVTVLGLGSASANAAGYWYLHSVASYNLFAPTGTPVNIIGFPVAFVDGLGNVSVNFINYSSTSTNATFNYTGGTWSAVVGGNTVTHTETCTETAPTTPCSNPLSGLSGIWATGLKSNGSASNFCSATAFFGAGPCDRVSIVEVPGVTLTIIEQSEFAIPGFASGYIYRFHPAPVPAAVWLFGSALGLLGLRRRVAQ